MLRLFLLLAFSLSAAEVDAIGITVADLDRSIAFYTNVLNFQPETASPIETSGERYERLNGLFGMRARTMRLRLGAESIELTEYLAPAGGRPVPADSRSNDRWFQHIAIIVSDMDRAYKHLRNHKVRHASSGPQRLPDWNPNAGGIEAFYFLDPDGHALEILAFPPGKGDPRWQSKDALFLGIDHTAIVVSDTDASVRFYRDKLGLRVAGHSENYGPEQERLNNVFGARLRITALRGDKGPGIEFLEYLAPSGGRPLPADEKSNDLTHWRTCITKVDLDRLAPKSIVSLETHRALEVRDPDGHAIRLSQPCLPTGCDIP